MKTNLFRFLKQKRNKIVIEEEIIDSPFLAFFRRYRKYILTLLVLLSFITLIVSLYFAMINMKDVSKLVTNINYVVVDFNGDTTINSVNMKPITGGQAIKEFYKRYGNIGLREGVIFVVKEVSFKKGTITFYSDGSAKIVGKDGHITRVSALEDVSYGIKENGDIIIDAKVKNISIINTVILEDGTKVIYYSDNSCEIINDKNKNNMLVRNSERVVIKDNRLITINPSGVTVVNKNEKNNGYKITYYEDGTIKIEKGNDTYIVRSQEDVTFSPLDFLNNNSATVLKTVNLKDGSKIIYYTDGSAEIIKNNESIIVRQSKDIIYTNERVIEIVETRYANETIKKTTPQNQEIIYLDNGGALIKNPNGTYEYVNENSDIKYNEDGSIKEVLNTIKEKFHKTTTDGTIIINLENGMSVIIDDNGYRIIETDKIIYDPDGNIKGIFGEESTNEGDSSTYESNFVIENLGDDNVKFIVAIEISDNYKDYAPVKLDPIYLRYNLAADTHYLENKMFEKKMSIGTKLQGDVEIKKETYILYEGTLESGKSSEVNLGIWLDYDDITNDYQDSVFVGTIKIYSETIE